MFFLHPATDEIMLRIGELRDALGHAENEENGSVNTDRNAGIPLLYLAQSRAADRCPFRHQSYGNTSATPRVPYVIAQFPQSTANRNGQRRMRL